jgi:hypothetical protein
MLNSGIAVAADRAHRIWQVERVADARTLVWANETSNPIVDMQAEDETIYVLSQRDQSIVLIGGASSKGKLREYTVAPGTVTDISRLVVGKRQGGVVAFVGPTADGEILELSLGNNPNPRPRRLVLDFLHVSGPRSLGPTLGLCFDRVNDSLLRADTAHHRILEASCKSGLVEWICGTGRAGSAKDGTATNKSAINAPEAVAIYRHRDVIGSGFLEKPSQQLLEMDKSGVLPRSILIADSGNYSVRKIVQLPIAANAVIDSMPQGDRLYTFLGDGKRPPNSPVKLPLAEKLTESTVWSPIRLAVSGRGTLLVGYSDAPYVTLLKPMTATVEGLSDQISVYNSTQPS